MTTKKRRSKKLLVARNMPPLYHVKPGSDFDINKSETVEWLISQPEIKSYVWDLFKQSDEIDYESESGLWMGVDFGN